MPLRLINGLIGSWFFFNILWSLLSLLPHAQVHFISWINQSFYSLLFLLALFLVKLDVYKRPVFFALALYYSAHLVSILTIFTGKHYAFGTNVQAIATWIMVQIPIRVFGLLAALYLAAHYFLSFRRLRTVCLFLSVLVLAATWLLFKPFLPPEAAIRQSGWQSALSWRLFVLSVLPVVVLLTYGVKAFLSRRPDGRYMDLLAFMLFIIHFFHSLDILAANYGISIYSNNQFFLLACLMGTTIVLAARLCYLHTEEGKCFERLLFEPGYLNQLAVIFQDHTLLHWWPRVKKTLGYSLMVHLTAGVLYLILALNFASVYHTIKLTLLVLWSGVLLILINRKFKNSQTGIHIYSDCS